MNFIKPCLPLILILFLSINCYAKAQIFGTSANKKQVIPISKLLEDHKKYLGKEVTVKGMVVDVCAKRGCWLKLASDKKFQTLRIKVRDGEMVFPMSLRGKTAFVKGNLQAINLTQEQSIRYFKHIAHEQSQKFDPSKVKGPTTIYQINAKGALIE